MLLDEDPAALIAISIANFNIAADKSCLKRTHAALSTLSSVRSSVLSQHKQDLTALSRKCAALQNANSIALSSHSAPAHAAEMLRLDGEKFRIAKEASELEIEGERIEKEIASAKRALEDVEAELESGGGGEDKQGNGSGNDETVLKLKVYRMLGIDVEPDVETGGYKKAVVRNREKGDVRVVNIDGRFSRWFYADYFWGCL